MSEAVKHPNHYFGPNDPDGTYEVIKIIEAWGLGFKDGNVLKYLLRWKQKNGVVDLDKAIEYLQSFRDEQAAELQTSTDDELKKPFFDTKFNLEAALAGAPLVTRDGREATQFHKRSDIGDYAYPYAAFVRGCRITFTDGGYQYKEAFDADYDLFMKEPS